MLTNWYYTYSIKKFGDMFAIRQTRVSYYDDTFGDDECIKYEDYGFIRDTCYSFWPVSDTMLFSSEDEAKIFIETELE